MDYGSRASAPQASAVLHETLHKRGFELGDFRVSIRPASDWGPAPCGANAMIEVRCRSTGEERLYPVGLSSAWLGAFVMDLAGGHFARAARRRADPTAAPRPVLGRLREWRRSLQEVGRVGRRLALRPSP
jgi:hypothetical protein